jgi:hypothetical protein
MLNLFVGDLLFEYIPKYPVKGITLNITFLRREYRVTRNWETPARLLCFEEIIHAQLDDAADSLSRVEILVIAVNCEGFPDPETVLGSGEILLSQKNHAVSEVVIINSAFSKALMARLTVTPFYYSIPMDLSNPDGHVADADADANADAVPNSSQPKSTARQMYYPPHHKPLPKDRQSREYAFLLSRRIHWPNGKPATFDENLEAIIESDVKNNLGAIEADIRRRMLSPLRRSTGAEMANVLRGTKHFTSLKQTSAGSKGPQGDVCRTGGGSLMKSYTAPQKRKSSSSARASPAAGGGAMKHIISKSHDGALPQRRTSMGVRTNWPTSHHHGQQQQSSSSEKLRTDVNRKLQEADDRRTTLAKEQHDRLKQRRFEATARAEAIKIANENARKMDEKLKRLLEKKEAKLRAVEEELAAERARSRLAGRPSSAPRPRPQPQTQLSQLQSQPQTQSQSQSQLTSRFINGMNNVSVAYGQSGNSINHMQQNPQARMAYMQAEQSMLSHHQRPMESEQNRLRSLPQHLQPYATNQPQLNAVATQVSSNENHQQSTEPEYSPLTNRDFLGRNNVDVTDRFASRQLSTQQMQHQLQQEQQVQQQQKQHQRQQGEQQVQQQQQQYRSQESMQGQSALLPRKPTASTGKPHHAATFSPAKLPPRSPVVSLGRDRSNHHHQQQKRLVAEKSKRNSQPSAVKKSTPAGNNKQKKKKSPTKKQLSSSRATVSQTAAVAAAVATAVDSMQESYQATDYSRYNEQQHQLQYQPPYQQSQQLQQQQQQQQYQQQQLQYQQYQQVSHQQGVPPQEYSSSTPNQRNSSRPTSPDRSSRKPSDHQQSWLNFNKQQQEQYQQQHYQQSQQQLHQQQYQQQPHQQQHQQQYHQHHQQRQQPQTQQQPLTPSYDAYLSSLQPQLQPVTPPNEFTYSSIPGVTALSSVAVPASASASASAFSSASTFVPVSNFAPASNATHATHSFSPTTSAATPVRPSQELLSRYPLMSSQSVDTDNQTEDNSPKNHRESGSRGGLQEGTVSGGGQPRGPRYSFNNGDYFYGNEADGANDMGTISSSSKQPGAMRESTSSSSSSNADHMNSRRTSGNVDGFNPHQRGVATGVNYDNRATTEVVMDEAEVSLMEAEYRMRSLEQGVEDIRARYNLQDPAAGGQTKEANTEEAKAGAEDHSGRKIIASASKNIQRGGGVIQSAVGITNAASKIKNGVAVESNNTPPSSVPTTHVSLKSAPIPINRMEFSEMPFDIANKMDEVGIAIEELQVK